MPKTKTEFGFNYEDFERYKEAVKRVGATSEGVINNYLHNTAGKNIAKSIDQFIPVAKTDKTHKYIPIRAKGNNWSEQDNYNLAVNISNSLKGKRGTSFYYLYYVATGTGTNAGKGPRDFMSMGLDKEYNNIVNGLIGELSTNIEKEMN